LGSAALTVSPRLGSQPAKLPRKPNLLVLLPDQQRRDTLACYGGIKVHAPNLNKLASQSVIFEHAYVTHPVCTPSRSSLHTGTWPHANGCISNQTALPRKFLCLPEMIGDGDYRAAYFGKWDLGDELVAQHGFEEWISIEDGYFETAAGNGQIEGQSDYGKFLLSKGYKVDRAGKYFSREFVSTLPFEFSKVKFLETKTCEFLQQHREQPFVIFVSFLEPHPPFNGPFNEEHSLDSITLDASSEDQFGDEMPLRYRVRQEAEKKLIGTSEELRKTKQKYLGLVTEVDRSVGVILAKLESSGLVENTITVLASDHGEMMGAHGMIGKEVMFEQSASIPYLVHMPGQQRELRCSQPISHLDFVPTMLELLGKPAHPQCVGHSRANLIRGDSSAPDSVFIEWAPNNEKPYKHSKLAGKDEMKRCLDEHTRSVVSPEGWKLCLRDQDKNELYNLRDDVAERHNLFYGGGHGDVIAKLTDEIHRWQERTSDTIKV
jgi:arylsulfatase